MNRHQSVLLLHFQLVNCSVVGSFFFAAFQEDSERYSRYSRRHASVCISSLISLYFVILASHFLFGDAIML